MFAHPPRSTFLVVAAVVWLVLIAIGFRSIHAYESTPGVDGSSPGSWPLDSVLRPSPCRVDIVVAVHPRCPCTRASLETLGSIVRDKPSLATVRLLIYRPVGSSQDWTEPGRARGSAAVPGAVAIDDPGGFEAARFGLATSGAAAVFDRKGRLQYVGGFNVARGSSEPSAGADALASILLGRAPDRSSCGAFGCPMKSLIAGRDRP